MQPNNQTSKHSVVWKTDSYNEPKMTAMHALPRQHVSHSDIKNNINLLGEKMAE